MDSVRKITIAVCTPTSASVVEKQHDRNKFLTPSCHSSIGKEPRSKKFKVCRKRLSFSPNINLFAMPSPIFSPIKHENCERLSTTPPIFDFSPRAINKIIKMDAEREKSMSDPNMSYLNHTISVENILKSCNMQKYTNIFRKEEIDNLTVFLSLTDSDLVEIGIHDKSDRIKILDICAIYHGYED